MYLKGSNWHMRKRRRRRRSRPIYIILLLLLIGAVAYFNQFIVPVVYKPFNPTPTATRDPEALLNEAQQQFEAGNLFQAIDAYERAILADHSNPSIYIELARVQILAGQYEAAQTSAQNALLLSPDNSHANAVLGWALSFLGNPVEAEAALIQAVELDPDNALAHAFLAELLADQGDYERAGAESRRALELDSQALEVRRARGYVLELTGNYEEALTEYRAALAINNNIADLHLALGRTYRAQELYDEAINEFVQANALNPTDPLPDTYITLIYLTTGEFAKAIQSAEKAVEEDPGNPLRYGNLGNAYYRNLQYREAIDAFTYAIQGGTTEDGTIVTGLPLDYGRVAEFYYMYGLALAYERRCAEALPVFQALLGNVPGDEIAVINAQEGLRICEESAAATPEPTEGEGEAGEGLDATPGAETEVPIETPVETPTP